ncbi:sugar kinase [uncultured Prevotella sp.]|uniref:sugar kinase n=1 Tax=uncultured Prevotella sp. TaxID=159272 RepID=UPI00263048AA|nr:sugar kinase [uncultured Prevotella sp.]
MKEKIVTFGEIMLRMTRPNKERIIQGSAWKGLFGGSEANVAVSLAMFGDNVEYVTRLPNNKIGMACLNEIRKYNVGTDYIVHGGDRLGLYYYEESAALRSSSIVYDREDSSITTIKSGMIDWKKTFSETRLFHWSGISSAVSQGAADATNEAVEEAEREGITISCDINHRANLWKYGKDAHDVLLPIAQKSDIVFGTADEWKLITGITPPDFKATTPDYPIDGAAYEEYFRKASKILPKAKKMIVALRNTLSANHHLLSGVIFADGKLYTTRIYDIDDVLDPMGVGDAFIAAYLHAHLKYGDDNQRCLNFSLAASALKNTILGDFNLSTEQEVEYLMNGFEE